MRLPFGLNTLQTLRTLHPPARVVRRNSKRPGLIMVVSRVGGRRCLPVPGITTGIIGNATCITSTSDGIIGTTSVYGVECLAGGAFHPPLCSPATGPRPAAQPQVKTINIDYAAFVVTQPSAQTKCVGWRPWLSGSGLNGFVQFRVEQRRGT